MDRLPGEAVRAVVPVRLRVATKLRPEFTDGLSTSPKHSAASSGHSFFSFDPFVASHHFFPLTGRLPGQAMLRAGVGRKPSWRECSCA